MMTDEPRNLIEIGYLPSGADVFVAEGALDPVSVLVADATRRLDQMRAEDERVRLAAITAIERVKATRRARTARRFRHALKLFTGSMR
jgi:hypothetical protein